MIVFSLKNDNMALEYMFFWLFGYLGCYLAFYVRSKRNLPLHENDTRGLILMIILLIVIGALRLFFWTK